jgi:hypothetical protein
VPQAATVEKEGEEMLELQDIKPITLIFLKSQHSFRHLSIAQKFARKPSKPESVQVGCMKELGDLELRMLPQSYLEGLIKA